MDNVQMGLCKGDMPIASLYAELTGPEARQEIFGDIQSRSGNMPEPAKKQLHNQIELIKSR